VNQISRFLNKTQDDPSYSDQLRRFLYACIIRKHMTRLPDAVYCDGQLYLCTFDGYVPLDHILSMGAGARAVPHRYLPQRSPAPSFWTDYLREGKKCLGPVPFPAVALGPPF
jgi:hypothetical protein